MHGSYVQQHKHLAGKCRGRRKECCALFCVLSVSLLCVCAVVPMNFVPHLTFFLFCSQTDCVIICLAEHPPLLTHGHFMFSRVAKLLVLAWFTVTCTWQSYVHTCVSPPSAAWLTCHVWLTWQSRMNSTWQSHICTRLACDSHMWVTRLNLDSRVMVTCDSHMLLTCDNHISTHVTHMFTHMTSMWLSHVTLACLCMWLPRDGHSLSPELRKWTLSQVWLVAKDHLSKISCGAWCLALPPSPIPCSAVIATSCISEQRAKRSLVSFASDCIHCDTSRMGASWNT